MNLMKIWDGRFKEKTDKDADDFNASLEFDKRLYKHDILGSIAHCTMLGECGIIEKSNAELICKMLNTICDDIETGRLIIQNAEDIHSFIEQELTARIGDVGKKLHTARSRNDQTALDLRLYLRDSADELIALLKQLIQILINISENNLDTLIPAFTHVQKAQPTTLAHHFCAYCEMFLRDIERLSDCRKRINRCPLGSCACTATSFPINRERVAKLLKFDAVTPNSLDAVSDRDFVIEYISACSVIMMHLSRFNEEIVYWSNDVFDFIELPDSFSTGSSIMPQKKNPDINELIRGKSGRVFGALNAILTVMKGLPLSYNKDMQEDKQLVFDTDDTVKACLRILIKMLDKIGFNKEVMAEATYKGFTNATDLADYLVKQGIPFRIAHEITGKLVMYCLDNGKILEELSISEFKSFENRIQDDVYSALNVKALPSLRTVAGSPAPSAVKAEINNLIDCLKRY